MEEKLAVKTLFFIFCPTLFGDLLSSIFSVYVRNIIILSYLCFASSGVLLSIKYRKSKKCLSGIYLKAKTVSE